jgi:hypothetical protein
MSLINGNNFIFIHIYKCGGMSLRKLFTDNLATLEINKSHSTAKEIRDYCYACNGSFFWNTAYKFSFVRNPFDWAVSLYEFIKNNESHENYQDVKDMDFDIFCYWYCENVKNKKDNINGKFNTLTDFLFDSNGELLVDYVGKLENINNDIKIVCDRLKISNDNIHGINVPHINQTDREPDYRKYYNETSKKLITDTFYYDLVNFNYSF